MHIYICTLIIFTRRFTPIIRLLFFIELKYKMISFRIFSLFFNQMALYFKLCLSFPNTENEMDWFSTKWNSTWCQNNYKTVNTIPIWFRSTRFIKYLSVCRSLQLLTIIYLYTYIKYVWIESYSNKTDLQKVTHWEIFSKSY